MGEKLEREILELMSEWPNYKWKARNITAKLFNQSRIGQKVTPALKNLREKGLIKKYPKKGNNSCFEYSITDKGKSKLNS